VFTKLPLVPIVERLMMCTVSDAIGAASGVGSVRAYKSASARLWQVGPQKTYEASPSSGSVSHCQSVPQPKNSFCSENERLRPSGAMRRHVRVGVGVFVGVEVGVGVGVLVTVDVLVGVAAGVSVGVLVAIAVVVNVTVDVGVTGGVLMSVCVPVAAGVSIGVGVGVTVGVAFSSASFSITTPCPGTALAV
jgi:hypothetical protein